MDPAEALERMRRSLLREPVRLAVMLLLAARPRTSFDELRRVLGVTPGNLWSHIEKLREEGLVRTYYQPRLGGLPRLYVEATGKGLEELFTYLQALRVLEEAGGLEREE